ncbi:hypothetical protein [Gordonia rhizosphera]|uniref:hypothetical protein n=1 Tax=Gordonia rhizosphera TaxID=83341 RepID=UPI0002DD73B3|nr:hypothetical protein [Gordonia rhizosphera]
MSRSERQILSATGGGPDRTKRSFFWFFAALGEQRELPARCGGGGGADLLSNVSVPGTEPTLRPFDLNNPVR